MLFHHVGVDVKNIQKSVRLYDALMRTLDIDVCALPPRVADKYGDSVRFYGTTGNSFRVAQRFSGEILPGTPIGLRAQDKKSVDDFYAVAINLGCESPTPPHETDENDVRRYYATVTDYDGNPIEAVYVLES